MSCIMYYKNLSGLEGAHSVSGVPIEIIVRTEPRERYCNLYFSSRTLEIKPNSD